MRDLEKYDTMPFFIGYYEKGCRDNTLTVIGSFREFQNSGKYGAS